MRRKASLSAYLTREEWQLAFAISFAHQYYGDVGPFDSFGEEMRYAVRYLGENGMEFQGVAVTADGRIIPTQEEPVCEANMASCALMLYGSSPDYATHLPAALDYAELAIPHLRSDIDMIEQAYSEVCEAVEDGRRDSRRALADLIREEFD